MCKHLQETCSWARSKFSLTSNGYHSKTNNQIKDIYIYIYIYCVLCLLQMLSFVLFLSFVFFIIIIPSCIAQRDTCKAKNTFPLIFSRTPHKWHDEHVSWPLYRSVCSEWSSRTDSKNFDFRLRAWAVDMFPKFVSCCLNTICKCMINWLYDVFIIFFFCLPLGNVRF